MSLSPEQLRFIAEYTASVIGKINQVLANRITTTFTNSNDVIPSSKLVKDEFTAVRSEMPTNTSDLTNDGADGTHAFIVEGDSRLTDTRNPKPHNQASSTITDTNTYSNIGNTLQDQASINSAINEKIGALMNLDIIEQVSTRPTASVETMNKIYAVPENDPTSENLFQYFITIYKDNAYKWDKIDIAQVDISGKVDKVEGKQLSTEDFTTAEKTKLSNIEPEANKTIVDSTFINNSTNPVQSNVIQTSLNSKANTSDLAAVATSGDYDDLTNKPNVVEKSATSGLIKNDGTIDTNQYLTSANIPESFNYGYVDSNLVLHLICVDGEVTATNSIIQSGDSNTITAVITDKDNNPLESMPVEFLFNGVKQGQSVNSNANGIATYNYTGTGAGKTDVQVKVGSFQSGIYDVWDTFFYDSDTATWQELNVVTSFSNNIRNLELTARGSGVYAQRDSSWFIPCDNDFIVEFDWVSDGNASIYIPINGVTVNMGVATYSSTWSGKHIKLHVKPSSNETDIYIDGVYQSTSTNSRDFGTSEYCGFRITNNTNSTINIELGNFKIYSA